MNRPPPPMENDRKSWMHNNIGNPEMPQMDEIDLADSQVGGPPLGIPPPNPNFMNNRGNFTRGNFRGQNRGGGGKMMRGGINNNNPNNNSNNGSPYNMNNFKNRGRGRGFRGGAGNFRGGQW